MTALFERYTVVQVGNRYVLKDGETELGTYDTAEAAEQARSRRIALGG